MEDLKAKLDKLIAEAAECDLIGNLASDSDKRDLFRRLADLHRAMAEAVRQEIAKRSAA